MTDIAEAVCRRHGAPQPDCLAVYLPCICLILTLAAPLPPLPRMLPIPFGIVLKTPARAAFRALFHASRAVFYAPAVGQDKLLRVRYAVIQRRHAAVLNETLRRRDTAAQHTE